MAKVARSKHIPPLVIGLFDAGMTPLLRAGLGGLAAAVRAIHLRANAQAQWPVSVPIGPGVVHLDARHLTLDFCDAPPQEVLRVLFTEAFQIRQPPGLIDLPGSYDVSTPRSLVLLAAQQSALKLTFLQHGSTTTKDGVQQTHSEDLGEQTLRFSMQPYTYFVHQDAWEAIVKALPDRTVDLAGWAYPGAAQRHILYPGTRIFYTPAQALCGCFALIGCLSFKAPRSVGVLVIPEPDDLIRFAEVRPRLSPGKLADWYISGIGDAVLATESTLRLEKARPHRGVAAVHGILLRATPWAKQQKSRVFTMNPGQISDSVLDIYEEATRSLPTTIRVLGDRSDQDEGEGYFAATSALRGFIADNLAGGRPWFRDFATATTGGKTPRYLHRYRSRGDDLGALYSEERKGLVAMLSHLEAAEQALVSSVHTALRHRLRAIADECQNQPATMKNRWQGERDKWRLAFAGSKTADQIRAHLADLWSRAGSNRELQEHWKTVLPLLRKDQWQVARDLALVALASYQSNREQAGIDDDGEQQPT